MTEEFLVKIYIKSIHALFIIHFLPINLKIFKLNFHSFEKFLLGNKLKKEKKTKCIFMYACICNKFDCFPLSISNQ